LKKVIITRPIEDALPLAEKLRSMGLQAVILPLLAIRARDAIEIPRRPYQAICITSANGIRFIPKASALFSIPVLAVGPQSLAAAQSVGFGNVLAQGGDVAGLADYVAEHLQPEQGPILYLSGAETSGDLEGKLQAYRFEVDRVVIYDAVAAKLDGHETEILAADGVLLYSPRSAKLWHAEISALKIAPSVAVKRHFCLSENVAQALPQNWHKTCVHAATEQAILATLDCWRKEE
jgi:uroporphyrinogen-III synthase